MPMMHALFTRWPLRYTVPLCLFLVATIGGWAGFAHERTLDAAIIREEGQQRLDVFTRIQALALREHLVAGDLDALRAAVAAFALDPTLVDARLVRPDGRELATFGRVGAAAPDTGTPSLIRVTAGIAGMDAAAGTVLGQLTVARDLASRLAANEARLRGAFARYCGYVLASMLALWLLLDRLVWRRVRALGVAAARVANGEFAFRADARGSDEIAVTARLGNRAAEQVERTQQASQRLIRALEKLAAAEPGESLFDTLAAAVAEGLDGCCAIVARRGPTDDELSIVGTAGIGTWQTGQRVPFDSMPCRACIDAPERIVVVERDVSSMHPGAAARCAGAVESFHGIAIADANGRWIGVLSVLGARPRVDLPADRALLRTAAIRLAQEFERADREARLREREQHLALAMDVAAVTVTVWNVETDAIDVRGNWLERFDIGRAPDGRPRMADWLAAIHPDDRPATTRLAETLRSADERTDRVDYRMRARDGSWRWVRGRAQVIAHPDADAPRYVVSVHFDIHDLIATRQDLRASESDLSLALDAGELSIADWYPATDELRLSPWWLRDLGYPDGAIGTQRAEVTRLVHPHDVPAIASWTVAHLRGEPDATAIEFRLRRHDGSWRWTRAQARVTARDAQGRATRMTGVLANIDAARQVAEKLRERTELLELAFRGTADGLWSWNADVSDGLYLSPRLYELLGREPGTLPTTPLRFEAAVYYPEDRPRIRSLMTRMLAHPEEGDILSCEVRLQCGDGQYRWFHNRAALTRHPDGSPARLAGSISDVHERRLREEEATAARQRLSDAIEAIDSGLLISDRDNRLVMCNRRYREMYGFPPEMLSPGADVTELARDLMRRYPDYRKGLPLEEAVQRRIAMHRAKVGRWELELGGRWYHIGDYETADGGVVSLRTDITHLKHVEQALRERTEFLEAAVRGSMDGIYDVDLIGDRIWLAPRFHELLGYADGELPTVWSVFCAEHHHPDEAEIRAATLAQVAQGDAEFISREMRLKCKDGHWHWYHGRAAVLRDAQGRPCRLIGSLSDTSERHRREEELAQARQQLQDAIESLDVGIVMFDRNERLVLFNRRFREMYGECDGALAAGVPLATLVRA
ncbi:MAG: PAS domain-containing protein, partial [Gammaproteobacteria bacterium]|nr:PAS domain-containing protein [Gammaproteobacteria bacterium]